MKPRDDAEAFEIRATAGDGPACDINPVEPVQPVTPLPPDVACDPPVVPDEETFFSPPPAPPVTRTNRLPAPLTIYSPGLSLVCEPPQVQKPGDPLAEIPIGALTRTIDLAAVGIFDQHTLYNLASVVPRIQAVIGSPDADGFLYGSEIDVPTSPPEARAVYFASGRDAQIAELVEITNLPAAVVGGLWDYIIAQQLVLDSVAAALVARLLTCGYLNEPLWVVCFDQETQTERVVFSPPDPLGDAVEVEAGLFFSAVSVEDANRLAVLSVSGEAPNCGFLSDELTITCAEEFGPEFSDDEGFPWPTVDDLDIVLSDIGGAKTLSTADVLDVDSDAHTTIGGDSWFTYADVLTLGANAEARKLILSVTILGGAATGTTQDEANAMARALALLHLDCFIPSRERTLSCTDAEVSATAYAQASSTSVEEVLSEIATGYTDLGMPEANVTFLVGPVLDESVRTHLVVPAGAFAADSHELANANAEAYANASIATLLDCNWRNRSVTYACDDVPGSVADHLTDFDFDGDENGVTNYPGPYLLSNKLGQMVLINALESPSEPADVELMASVEKSTPYVRETPRGTFSSPVSQFAVDTIAAASAMAELGCVYCNPDVAPNCPPDEYTLPLDPNEPGYSFDATRGMQGVGYAVTAPDGFPTPRWTIIPEVVVVEDEPEDHVPMLDPTTFVCSVDPQEVANVADDTSSTPIRSLAVSTECRFCNDEIVASCCVPPGVDGDDIDHVQFDELQCIDLISDYEGFATDGCDGIEVSNPYNLITIPECSVFANSKEEANALALGIAKSQLACLFTNSPVELECEDKCEGNVGTVFSVTVGGQVYSSTHGECILSGGEEGGTSFVEAGLFKSACSKEQANLQAEAMAAAQLSCLWCNETQFVECPEPPPGSIYHSTAVYEAEITECSIISADGTHVANVIALRLAAMQLFCAFTNEEQCGGCVVRGEVPRGFGAVDNNGGFHSETCFEEDFADGNPPPTCISSDTIVTMISTEFANDRARELLPAAPCVWDNNTVTEVCEDHGRPHPSAILSVTIGAGTVQEETLCQATGVAFYMAVAQLVCLWTNEEQKVECPEDFIEINPGEVPADTIIAPTTAIADLIALSLAEAKLACEPPLFSNTSAYFDQCPGFDLPEDERRWELETVGEVEAGEISSFSFDSANAIAESIAISRMVCKPVYNCNPETATGFEVCPALDRDTCQMGIVGSETLCAYGYLESELQAIAQTLADANTVCCPNINFNTEVEGDKDCEGALPPCVVGVVAAGLIPSYASDDAAGVAEATAIAQGIADAMTFCCEDVGGGGGGGCNEHPWKVTYSGAEFWHMRGDTVYGMTNNVDVPDIVLGGATGFIYLEIVRDVETREILTVTPDIGPVVPESDYSSQYRVIAYVDSGAECPVTQYQFEEIRILEELLVANGEFRLAGYEMSHRSYYEIPSA